MTQHPCWISSNTNSKLLEKLKNLSRSKVFMEFPCLLGLPIQMWSHFYWYTLSNSDPMFIWTPCPTLNPMFIGTPCPTLLLCLLGHPVQLWSYVYWDTLTNSDPMFIGTPCPTLIPCLLGHPVQLWSHVYWDTLSNSDPMFIGTPCPTLSIPRVDSGKCIFKESLMSELLFCFLVQVFPWEEGKKIQPENWTRRNLKWKKRKHF